MDVSSHLFKTRLTLLSLVFLGMTGLIVMRLIQLQIYNGDIFFSRSQRNFMRTEKITSLRGDIHDCFGRPLATNRPVTILMWQGTGNKEFDAGQIELLNYLEYVCSLPFTQDQALRTAEVLGRSYILMSDISLTLLSKILERYPHHKNMRISTHFKRFYPYESLACHILGYLGSLTSEGAGQMGLEKIFENDLKGTPGQLLKTVNSWGQALAEQEIQHAREGEHLRTTIDLDIQRIAEELFPQEYAGALIIMEPRTGALRAVISQPSFNPNVFVNALTDEEWKKMQTLKNPFVNRVFNAMYPPASLFKLVTMSVALENGLATPESLWYCRGHTTFAGRRYHCNRKQGHGMLTTEEAIEHSCNIPFYELAKKIKIDSLHDYAHKFGLGSPTHCAFPEKSGLIPSSEWKRRVKGEPWWPGETFSAVIGQSYLLATPIQLICMASSICEGFLVRPRILEAEPIDTQQLTLSPATLQFLRNSMEQVVNKGTAQRLRGLRNIKIYAKTGTAQTSALSKQNMGEAYQEHAWLVAHISYKDHEPFALLIILEHAKSSKAAIPVASQVIKRYRQLLDTRTQKLNSPNTQTVTN